MMGSRSSPQSRNGVFSRVRPFGLTLTLLALACSPSVHHETSLGSGVTIAVDSPDRHVRYPNAAQVRITVRNAGTAPYTFTWPPDFRLQPGCNAGLQRQAVEVWFRGLTFDRGLSSSPYVWHWTPSPPPPATFVLQPGETRVLADVSFQPPKGAYMLDGGFCSRVYGHDIRGGSMYQGPGK